MNTSDPTEADILGDVLAPMWGDDPVGAARAILKLKFSKATQRKVSRLLRQNSHGEICAEDRLLLHRYLRVGTMLDTLQAKARLVLKNAGVQE